MYGGVLLAGLATFVVAGVWLSEDPDSAAATALAVGAFVGTPIVALLVWFATRPSEDEGARIADQPTESLTPSELRLRLTNEWRPATEQQRAAAAAIAKRRTGALVRHRPDGVTEVLTGSRGAFTRYEIAVDGRETVVETIPSDGSYRTAGRMVLIGLAVLGVGILIVRGDTGLRDGLGGVSIAVGVITALFGLLVMSGEDGEHGALLRTQPGERWMSIGYPSD